MPAPRKDLVHDMGSDFRLEATVKNPDGTLRDVLGDTFYLYISEPGTSPNTFVASFQGIVSQNGKVTWTVQSSEFNTLDLGKYSYRIDGILGAPDNYIKRIAWGKFDMRNPTDV